MSAKNYKELNNIDNNIKYYTGIEFNKIYSNEWVLIVHRKSCSFIDINGNTTYDAIIWEVNKAHLWIKNNNGKDNKWYVIWKAKVLDNTGIVTIQNNNICPSNILISFYE